MTQRQTVLKYLENHKRGITSLDAIQKFGITRLSNVIYVLKKEGHNIASKLEPVTNRQGGVCWVSRYILEK